MAQSREGFARLFQDGYQAEKASAYYLRALGWRVDMATSQQAAIDMIKPAPIDGIDQPDLELWRWKRHEYLDIKARPPQSDLAFVEEKALANYLKLQTKTGIPVRIMVWPHKRVWSLTEIQRHGEHRQTARHGSGNPYLAAPMETGAPWWRVYGLGVGT